jgi:ATP-dependent 26S proteasome regulatory subunit
MAWRTAEQRLASAQLQANRLDRIIKKSLRSRDARKKIVIAGAMLAEARDNGQFEQLIKTVARRRVTRPEDVAVIAEWLSTT